MKTDTTAGKTGCKWKTAAGIHQILGRRGISFIETGRAGQLHTVMGKDTVQLLHALPMRVFARLEETGSIVCAV